MYACIHAPDAGAQARNFSPWVERVDDCTAVFTLTPRQVRDIQAVRDNVASGPSFHMAIASTAEAAMLAARHLPGFTFVTPGEELRILGALPVDDLPSDPEIFETLDMWGIRTLADLAQLPEQGIAERLGERGLHLHKLARGALNRPLNPELAATVYEASAELDYPIKLREPLMFLIGRFLFDLLARMKAQSVAAQALRLGLNREERCVQLPFPTRDLKLLLKLVEHSLERQPPQAPVERVYLELAPTEPRRVQHGLFTLAAPEPEKLELTLGKIRGLVGDGNVGYAQLFDTHRPGAGHPTNFLPRLAFRYFRPALEARVELSSGTPKQLSTRMFKGNIVQAAGPWRTSGDWWKSPATCWDRDEWDVALADGAICRLCRTRSGAWSVEGVYD